MAASSSGTSAASNYTEVYIWLAKDSEGYTTTSSEGGRLTPSNERTGGRARCGHASMGIFPQGQKSVYISLWPGSKTPGVLLDSLEQDQSSDCEGTLPDVIIRLHHLDIAAMLKAFNTVKPRVANGEIQWAYQVSDSADVTTPPNSTASCASFVYTFLKIGGFKSSHSTYNKVSSTGPKDKAFYQITKCNAGDRWGGIFNWAPWTGWIFSPKALLLRTASAADADLTDRARTIEIMQSDRVAKEKERGWGETVALATTVATAAALVYSAMKKPS